MSRPQPSPVVQGSLFKADIAWFPVLCGMLRGGGAAELQPHTMMVYPLIVTMSVPMAIFGAMVFLFFGFATLNVYTQVGLVTLVGLIAKHGILIVQFANDQRALKKSKLEAIEIAAETRLRPILMTTAAMVLGVMPLVITSGAGAVGRNHMGPVIATGISIGTAVRGAGNVSLDRLESRARAAP